MIRQITNFLAKKFKAQEFLIDRNFSSSNLLQILFIYGLKFFRGLIRFPLRPFKKILIGKRVTLMAKNKIVMNSSGYLFDDDVFINAFSKNGITLGAPVSIQKRVIIECSGSLTELGVGLEIGNYVGIGSNSFLGCAGGVTIGDNTILGNFVSIHSENHISSDLEVPIRNQGTFSKGVSIGANCWVGAKATILDGVILKDGCIIAAGSVVLEGVYEENSIIGGVPARILKKR